jgi:hypothetical protein
MKRFKTVLPFLFITLLSVSCKSQNNVSQTNPTVKPVSATSTPSAKPTPSPTPKATPTPEPTPVPTPTPLPVEQRDFDVNISFPESNLSFVRLEASDNAAQRLPLQVKLKGGTHTFYIFEIGQCRIINNVTVDDSHTSFVFNRAQCTK